MPFIAPLADGLRRVARAPMVLAGAAMLTAAVALPPGLLLTAGQQAGRGEPTGRGTAAACIPLHWWRFSHDVYPVDGRPCAAGLAETDAAGPYLRALLDDRGPDPAFAGVVVAYLVAWTLFSAGAIDRYARDRPTRGAGFFAACGVYGPRLLRLALVAGVVYWGSSARCIPGSSARLPPRPASRPGCSATWRSRCCWPSSASCSTTRV